MITYICCFELEITIHVDSTSDNFITNFLIYWFRFSSYHGFVY